MEVLRYAVVLILCWSPASPLSLQATGKSTGSGLLSNEPNTDQLIANKLFKTRPSSSVDRSPNVVDTGLETETSDSGELRSIAIPGYGVPALGQNVYGNYGNTWGVGLTQGLAPLGSVGTVGLGGLFGLIGLAGLFGNDAFGYWRDAEVIEDYPYFEEDYEYIDDYEDVPVAYTRTKPVAYKQTKQKKRDAKPQQYMFVPFDDEVEEEKPRRVKPRKVKPRKVKPSSYEHVIINLNDEKHRRIKPNSHDHVVYKYVSLEKPDTRKKFKKNKKTTKYSTSKNKYISDEREIILDSYHSKDSNDEYDYDDGLRRSSISYKNDVDNPMIYKKRSPSGVYGFA